MINFFLFQYPIVETQNNTKNIKAYGDGDNNYIDRTFVDPSPFAFYMFENFIISQKVFSFEQRVISVLRNLKLILLKYRTNVYSFMHQRHKNDTVMLLKIRTSRKKFHTYETINNYKNCQKDEAIEKSLSVFPKNYDYEGAIKAMVILYATYNFNLTKKGTGSKNVDTYQTSSKISKRDFAKTKIRSFPSNESLAYDDFILLSHRAGHFYRYFDTAIYLSREAMATSDEYSSTSKLYEYLLEMQRYFIRVHNSFLLKNKNRIGRHYKTASYLFDDNGNFTSPNIAIKVKGNLLRFANVYFYLGIIPVSYCL